MKTFFSEYPYDPNLRKNRHLPIREQNAAADIAATQIEGTNADRFAGAMLMRAEIWMLNKRGVDYFLESPELGEMLLGLAKDFTPTILDVFAEDRATAFVIHPNSPNPAVLVGIATAGEQTCAVFSSKKDGEFVSQLLSFQDYRAKERTELDGYAISLAVGLALYLRFFPHAAKDGIPDTAKHPAHYKGKPCVRVGLVEELIDRSGPTPHIRAAHVRVLQHPRFTHKQGQEVWVKASFVAGKSKFVCEVEGDIKGRIKA